MYLSQSIPNINSSTAIIGNAYISATARGILPDTGADVRLALDALIDELEAMGGGILDLDEGTYLLGSPANSSEGGLRVKTANPRVWIRGKGRGATVLKAMDNLNKAMTGIIRTTSGDPQRNFKISDLTIDGNRANQTFTTVGIYTGVSPNDPADCVVVGTTATFTYATAHGRTAGQTIFIDSWTQKKLSGDFVIVSTPTATTLTVTVPSGTLSELQVPTYEVPFAQLYDADISIINVEVMNCKKGTSSGGYGIDPHEITVRLFIDNCYAHHNDGPGIALDGIRNFYVNAESSNNEGAAIESYTRTMVGTIFIRGDNNGNNSGGSRINSVGFEGSSYNVDVFMNITNARGNGLTIGFGSSVIRAYGSIDTTQHHGVQIRGGQDCIIDVTVIDPGQAANNTYDGIYNDGGQAGYSNANNNLKIHLVSRSDVKARYGIHNTAGCTGTVISPMSHIPQSAVASGPIEDIGAPSIVATVRSAAGMHPGWVSGRWYPALPGLGDAFTNLTIVENRLYLIPFWIPPGERLNQSAIEVTVTGSGTITNRVGIYGASKGIGSGLIVDQGTFTITNGTTGAKVYNHADSRIGGGLYFLAWIANGAVTMPQITARAADPLGWAPWLFGYSANNLQTGTPVVAPSGGWFYDDTAAPTIVANGLPATLPALTQLAGAVPWPLLQAGA